jgi:hypothetical protein
MDPFFRFRRFETLVLQERVGDHSHERISVQALPRSPFEVIEAKLFLHLLMGLVTDPTRLDGGGEPLKIGVRRKIRA